MTWGQFKAKVEAEGVKDDTKILYIDTYPVDELNVMWDDEDMVCVS